MNLNTITKSVQTKQIACFCVASVIMILALSTGIVFAASNPLENLGTWLISGLKILVAAAALCVGIISIVKGQTVKGIVVLIVGALLYALCSSPTTFGNVGTTILGAFGF